MKTTVCNIKISDKESKPTYKRLKKSEVHQNKPKIKIKKRGRSKKKRVRIFSKRFEQEIVYRLLVAIEMGYKITLFIVCGIIKLYLDRVGIDCQHFVSNLPTEEFVQQFLRRHRKILGQKINESVTFGQLFVLETSRLAGRLSAGTDLLEVLDKCVHEILTELTIKNEIN